MEDPRCDELRLFGFGGVQHLTRKENMSQPSDDMSQSTLTALQASMRCDMIRQAETWQTGAAREIWGCDMEGYSATRQREAWRANVNCYRVKLDRDALSYREPRRLDVQRSKRPTKALRLPGLLQIFPSSPPRKAWARVTAGTASVVAVSGG
jgi:hypothetical protein